MKLRIRLLLSVCFLAVASACGGSGSGSSEPGIETAFTMSNAKSVRNQGAPAAEEGQTFYTAEGKRIDLENGFFSVSVAGLTGCSSALADFARTLGGFLLSSAAAHGNAVEAPEGVVDVSKTDGSRFELGLLPATPGSYCGVELELLPLPHDAPGGDAGALVYLAPCYYPDSGTIPDVPGAPVQPDEVNHSCYRIPVVATAPVVRLAFASPLMLNSANRNARITITVEYDTWFDGVDVPALATGDSQASQQLMDNLVASLRLSES
jgi:hypothetical protein